MTQIRLNKHIAALGYCSRRKADELIAAGRVKVNGKAVREHGVKVDDQTDTIDVIGLSPSGQEKASGGSTSPNATDLVYLVMNKPVDYITSTTSTQGKSVMDLLTRENQVGKYKIKLKARVYPVGRLDKDSEGLVLLTNDGELANQLTHPSFEHEKEYEVTIDQQLKPAAKKVLESGMRLGEETVSGVKIVKEWNQGRRTIVTVIMNEGKNRQIRKMFGRLGYNVSSLKRTRMSNLTLGTIPPGKWKVVRKSSII